MHNLAPCSDPNDQPEGGWPQIRARLAAEKIAERRNRAASLRDYMYSYVPGGRSENMTPASQGRQ